MIRNLINVFGILWLFFGFSFSGNIKLLTPQKVELGNAIEGDTLEYTVKFTVTGGERVDFYKVKSSCRCTVLDSRPFTLEAGDTVGIKVLINTNGMSGRVSRGVTFFTDDEENKQIHVFFRLSVTSLLEVKPPFINLQHCVKGKSYHQLFTLTNNMEQTVTIIRMETEINNMDLKYDKNKLKKGESLDVLLTFEARKTGGDYGIILIYLKGAPKPVYKIPVYVRVGENE